MRKIYLLSLLFGVLSCFVFTACGDDDAPSLTVTPGSAQMYYDKTQQLSAPGATNWTTEDEFVANVNQSGLVTANHVGTTNIVASNGDSKGLCMVTVIPKYNLYDTPILKWGATMSEIKAEEKHTLGLEQESQLGYEYFEGSVKTLIVYMFENNVLNAVIAVMNRDYYALLGLYLIERYQPAGYKDDLYIFMDAMDSQKANVFVGFTERKYNNTTVATAMYMANTFTRSAKEGWVKDFNLEKYEDFLSVIE